MPAVVGQRVATPGRGETTAWAEQGADREKPLRLYPLL
jgi:hypothetical protein